MSLLIWMPLAHLRQNINFWLPGFEDSKYCILSYFATHYRAYVACKKRTVIVVIIIIIISIFQSKSLQLGGKGIMCFCWGFLMKKSKPILYNLYTKTTLRMVHGDKVRPIFFKLQSLIPNFYQFA